MESTKMGLTEYFNSAIFHRILYESSCSHLSETRRPAGVSLTLSELLQGEGGDGETPLQEVCSHLLVAAHLGAVDAVDQATVSRRLHHHEGQDIPRGVQVETVKYGRSQLPHPALLHLQGAETTFTSTPAAENQTEANAETTLLFSEFK